MRSVITGFENEAAEFGLARMRETHPEANVVCKKKFTSLDKNIKVNCFSHFYPNHLYSTYYSTCSLLS